MTGAPPVRCAVVIPAYRPSDSLLDLVSALTGPGSVPIVLVDDGSGCEFGAVFEKARAFPGVYLLRHDNNLGKGAALKTGMRFAHDEYPALTGVVTADADGQHAPEDIRRIVDELLTDAASRSPALLLGARSFRGTVPLRSRLGNVLTSAIMHLLLGRKLNDTQTGLRGIPAQMIAQLLELDANGYEFELEMLILAHQLGMPVKEEPIRTIYEAGNRSSHFNPLVDSMKIYFVLARFTSVSLLTALLDNLVFYLAYRRTGHVLASQVIGRVLAVTFNYWMVRRSVFYSRQRHLATLPKYLALVIASGAASYGGIRLLGAGFGIQPVAAKIAVESALFFANFAVQRLLIFRHREQDHRGAVSGPALIVGLILAACTAAEAYGFSTGHLFTQVIWHPSGLERFWRYCRLFALFSVPMLALAPRYYLAAVAAIALVGTYLAAGPWALAAAALLLISAWALGSYLVEDGLVAMLCGLGAFLLLMLLSSRAPVQYAGAWAAVLLIPIALHARGLAGRVAKWSGAFRERRAGSIADRASLALLVFVLGAHWLVVLTPENSADGLAMHLAVATNIAQHHAFTFQPGSILWAVMPMGADWAYAIAYLLGGELASHLVNFAMLLALCGLLYGAVRRWVPHSTALLLLALFAASPLVQLVTGSLFVENLLAAMLLGMLTALWRFGDTGNARYLMAAGILGGAALTTKLAALPFVVLTIPFAVWEVRRFWNKTGAARPLTAFGLLLATALPTYVLAWMRTGNPVFPFLNQTFRSRLLDASVEIRDFRFREPLTWHTPFDLTFHTSRFFEGQNGSFGFQYLLLVPLALAALWIARRRPAACAATVALASMLLVLRSEPNARYLYAAMPLLFVPFASVLEWTRRRQSLLHGALIGSALACTLLNLCFLPAAGWYHKDFYAHYEFRPGGFQRFLEEEAPVRAVVAAYNRDHPHSTMLLVDDSDLADARGTVFEKHWHQFDTWIKLQNAVNLPQMMELASAWKLEYFIGRRGAEEPAALRDYLAECTQTEMEHGGIYLSKVDPKCAVVTDPPPAGPGQYDDFDPVLRFHSDWTHGGEFPGAWQHTVSYTDTSGSEASLVFEGSGLTYVFTRAPNHGRAQLLIDGESKAIVDLYGTQPEWQSRYRICCLNPGRHRAVIRVLGESRKEATGRFVDLDALIVE